MEKKREEIKKIYKNLYLIGILGGIASGKSTIAKLFQNVGAYIINADKLVHQSLEDPNIKKKLRDLWGNDIIVDNKVNKKKLAKIVFPPTKDTTNLKKLENLIHPIIIRGIKEKLEEIDKKSLNKKSVVILDIALLWESGLYKWCDKLIFVDTPLEIRKKRAKENRNWEETEIEKREQYQAPLEEKREKADYIIYNDKNIEETLSQVMKIWEEVNKIISNQNK